MEAVLMVVEETACTGKSFRIVKGTYEGAMAEARVRGKQAEMFAVRVGLHQGSALTPLILITIMDDIINEKSEAKI